MNRVDLLNLLQTDVGGGRFADWEATTIKAIVDRMAAAGEPISATRVFHHLETQWNDLDLPAPVAPCLAEHLAAIRGADRRHFLAMAARLFPVLHSYATRAES